MLTDYVKHMISKIKLQRYPKTFLFNLTIISRSFV